MIKIKTKEEIDKIAQAGKILAKISNTLKKSIKPGITTGELDQLAQNEFQRFDVVSAFKGYRGFPAHICCSVNEEVVHGIPNGRKLQDGDLLSIDLGIKLDGYYADAAFTQAVGNKIKPNIKKLINVTRQALSKGINQARINKRISDISSAIQGYVESSGFSVVREFVGHGIGRELHEEPQIPNFGKPNTGELITEGMVFAIEPMVNMGSWQVDILENGWTAVTKDKMPSCHFEHTVAVLKDGPVILTQ
ncbi:MAG: type I methionyl aminopeptidase [Candidatus Omnitrophica bacterium]|nr:type I methionyl aminopeptidase [Candidatus Omnitrophota bacterium]MDD5352222.1 type I methionyl aminopeptidase [Candidatus Omnitrophota bacterium]MDD5549820.1 type I methionyl aminopeptidase [Candidatus Omnitrophota bacterium]